MAGIEGPAMPEALYKFVSIPESQAISLRETTCLGAEMVSFTEALGQIVAEDVLAPEPLPPFPASIKVSGARSYLRPPLQRPKRFVL